MDKIEDQHNILATASAIDEASTQEEVDRLVEAWRRDHFGLYAKEAIEAQRRIQAYGCVNGKFYLSLRTEVPVQFPPPQILMAVARATVLLDPEYNDPDVPTTVKQLAKKLNWTIKVNNGGDDITFSRPDVFPGYRVQSSGLVRFAWSKDYVDTHNFYSLSNRARAEEAAVKFVYRQVVLIQDALKTANV
jgi:hypothetical protein